MALMSEMEENLLVALVRGMAPRTDVSKIRNVSALIADVATIMSMTCAPTVNGVMLAKKMKELFEDYSSFIWFEAKPGVYYFEANNWVITTNEYFMKIAGRESEKHVRFRLHGMPRFTILREIFEQFGMQTVDWDWICLDLGGADKKWLPNPSP
ncbi:hypothetical protein C2S52_010342 [Perilla frutescens var. hirtella]|nr:hypothetical protein C2S52_010342 [Perilla frutescens var. hirtella]KAH6817196.1 hypothetical protein C2S51_000799 [Perilla frutescens var. frutescens]